MAISRISALAVLAAVLVTAVAAEDTDELQPTTVSIEPSVASVDIADSVVDAYGRPVLRVREDGSLIPVYLEEIDALSVDQSCGGPEADVQAAPSGDLFQARLFYQIHGGMAALAIGDVTGDGLNDIVGVNPDFDSVYVCPQSASGEMEAYFSYAAPIAHSGRFSGSVDIADMNSDGHLDVIVGLDNAVGVLFQNESGGLEDVVGFATAHWSGTNIYKLRCGDFNNDGLSDVASIDWGIHSHDVDIFLQTTSGSLYRSAVYVVEHGGYDDITTGDLNSDGLHDIVVMSGQYYLWDNLGILLQTATGAFDGPFYYDLGGSEMAGGVGVGDLNGDGRDDVVVSYGGNVPASFIGVFLQSDDGIVDTAFSLASYHRPQPVEVADINLDGRDDVLTAHGGWMRLGVYLQDDKGSLMKEDLYNIPYSSNYNTHALAVGDLNGDLSPDVAVARHGSNGGAFILYNATMPTVNVVVDIKPGSCPNPLNLKGENNLGMAVLPVAVLGSDDFDIRDIDPATVRLQDVPAVRWSYEDVAAPSGQDAAGCNCGTAGPDGFEDLTLKFYRSEIIATLLGVMHGDTVTLELEGTLLGGGTAVGSDCVWIRNVEKSSDVVARPLTGGVVLYANTPNPFNPTTEVIFSLPEATDVRLEIYNVMGQRVTTLVVGPMEVGEHRVRWDGRADGGQLVASGVYFYRLQTGNYTETKKMLLLK